MSTTDTFAGAFSFLDSVLHSHLSHYCIYRSSSALLDYRSKTYSVNSCTIVALQTPFSMASFPIPYLIQATINLLEQTTQTLHITLHEVSFKLCQLLKTLIESLELKSPRTLDISLPGLGAFPTEEDPYLQMRLWKNEVYGNQQKAELICSLKYVLFEVIIKCHLITVDSTWLRIHFSLAPGLWIPGALLQKI